MFLPTSLQIQTYLPPNPNKKPNLPPSKSKHTSSRSWLASRGVHPRRVGGLGAPPGQRRDPRPHPMRRLCLGGKKEKTGGNRLHPMAETACIGSIPRRSPPLFGGYRRCFHVAGGRGGNRHSVKLSGGRRQPPNTKWQRRCQPQLKAATN